MAKLTIKWNRAIELAKLHNFKDIEALLAKSASYLLEKKMVLNAIELFRKANLCHKSARLIQEV